MQIVEKAVACVLRAGSVGPDLLVFRHPLAGVQLPKGRVEPGETYADAARRELHEESGLLLESPQQRLGDGTGSCAVVLGAPGLGSATHGTSSRSTRRQICPRPGSTPQKGALPRRD